jgi:sterol desaturase/sphingolipid hydroxylase (fatty acid hydroxylase superfamily)
MANFLINHEPAIRVAAFLGIFLVMVVWEFLSPRRQQAVPRSARWPSNLGLVALNTLLMRLVLPTTAVGVAVAAEGKGLGLLNLLHLPDVVAFVLALVLLDLAICLQHVLFHKVPWLWRLHRMHHADVEVDATNGLRFHPIEILLSLGIKFALILIMGVPAAAVVVFEVLLNGLAVFNHSNVALAGWLDRKLRWFIVTPDMHRIHHSCYAEECSSNYGFNLTWWDRLFGTYRSLPRDGQAHMTLGLPEWRQRQWLRLDQMLLQPFVVAVPKMPVVVTTHAMKQSTQPNASPSP